MNNRVRRFYMYMSNRIERILRTTIDICTHSHKPRRMCDALTSSKSDAKQSMVARTWSTLQEMSEWSHARKWYPETDKEVKPVLAVHVMKTSIENHNVFGTHDSTSSHPGLLLLEPLPFNGTEYVSSNRRMLTTVPIYVSRLLRHLS